MGWEYARESTRESVLSDQMVHDLSAEGLVKVDRVVADARVLADAPGAANRAVLPHQKHRLLPYTHGETTRNVAALDGERGCY